MPNYIILSQTDAGHVSEAITPSWRPIERVANGVTPDPVYIVPASILDADDVPQEMKDHLGELTAMDLDDPNFPEAPPPPEDV